jgi:PAS domain S-box-containing protein
VLNVIASDIGRPISDLTLNVPAPDLARTVLDTIETMRPHERDLQDEEGRWYSMRVQPYRTHDHRIDGAVILLVDVDERRRALTAAREAQQYAEAIVSTVRQPLIVLDAQLRVVTANRGFLSTFEVTREQTEGRLIYDLGNRQWNVPRLRELLEKVIPQRAAFDDFEVEHGFPGIGTRTMLLNARRIEDTAGNPSRILLAIEDVTAKRRADAEREELLAIAERARAEAESVGELLRRVQTITETALLKLPLDDLLREVLVRVRDTLAGDTAVILLRGWQEEDNEVLHARAAVGIDAQVLRRVRVRIGEGFAGRIAATRKPLILDDVDYTEVVSPYLREKGIRSLVGVPLQTEGGLLGVLNVGSVQRGKFGQ